MCCDPRVRVGEPSWLASLASERLGRRPSTLPLPFLWANLTPLRPLPIFKGYLWTRATEYCVRRRLRSGICGEGRCWDGCDGSSGLTLGVARRARMRSRREGMARMTGRSAQGTISESLQAWIRRRCLCKMECRAGCWVTMLVCCVVVERKRSCPRIVIQTMQLGLGGLERAGRYEVRRTGVRSCKCWLEWSQCPFSAAQPCNLHSAGYVST